MPARTSAVVYIHGFASSPQSAKAAYFAERLAAAGVPFHCPDFNQPAFETLTMSRMLGRLSDELDRIDAPTVSVVGSSLGGAMAVLASERFVGRIDRLVLLAPALMFAKPGHHLLTPEKIAEWREKGALSFYHFGDKVDRTLHVGFFDDAVQYHPFETRVAQPTLVFQGEHDASVDPRMVEAFARTRPNVALEMLDDDHQLVASLPRIWEQSAPFLGLPA